MQGALERIATLRRQNHTLSQQFVDQQVPDLMSGVDPLATGVRAAKPRRSASREAGGSYPPPANNRDPLGLGL
jgi:hypothetical protein